MKCPSSIENTPQLMCLSEPRHIGLNSKATSRLTPKVPAEVGVGAEVYFFVDPRATGVKSKNGHAGAPSTKCPIDSKIEWNFTHHPHEAYICKRPDI